MELTNPDNRVHIAISLLIVFDFLWFSASLRWIYPKFTSTRLEYAIIAWVLTGISISCARPITYNESLIYGASLGAIIYGVFNGTEATINPEWRHIRIILSDTIWGSFLCMITSLLCFIIMNSSFEMTIIIISILIYVLAFLFIVLFKYFEISSNEIKFLNKLSIKFVK